MVEYERIKTPKKHILYEPGVGSLSTWYEESVESAGTKKIKYDTNEHFRGPLPLFPQLDVMPGAASSHNQAFNQSWGLTSSSKYPIDDALLNYEEALGGLHGYRIHNDILGDEEAISNVKMNKGLFSLQGQNIDEHASQAPHGKHPIDPAIAKASEAVANQHNVGDSQQARDTGLERGDNPAINTNSREDGQVYENKNTLDKDVPTAVPVDIDAIQVNGEGEITKPEDTIHVLGSNQTF